MENNEFNYKPHCPVIDVDGVKSNGKQFDLDITLPEDNRTVIYGTIRDCDKEPIKDAVIKLIEIEFDKDGMKKRIPISHTFTDEYGEFVFGPLCPNKEYAIEIWVNDVRNFKFFTRIHHDKDCLKGRPAEICECHKHDDVHHDKCDDKCDDKHDDKWHNKCDDKCEHKKDEHEEKCNW